ncbi:hypothetical protein AAFF_G00040020 [Aldrovandia affinis]|uniref:Uncharacterized protein n=1 Tax=Aldrovandia affinis TaxID=143900 RepID=A0AAD7WFC4_9TELE|nr:hypothetical protein AAFF_G00040020 [Aldrovandia affinis]
MIRTHTVGPCPYYETYRAVADMAVFPQCDANLSDRPYLHGTDFSANARKSFNITANATKASPAAVHIVHQQHVIRRRPGARRIDPTATALGFQVFSSKYHTAGLSLRY